MLLALSLAMVADALANHLLAALYAQPSDDERESLMVATGVSLEQYAVLGNLMTLTYVPAALFGGHLSDARLPRRAVVVGGACATAFAAASYAACTSFVGLAAAQLLLGLGGGALKPVAAAEISRACDVRAAALAQSLFIFGNNRLIFLR